MKRVILFLYWLLSLSILAEAFTLRPDIAKAVRKSGQYTERGDAMSREDPIFVNYMIKNWRQITEDIECLPPIEAERTTEEVKFNASVVNFGLACCNLPPLEYLEFFEQFVALYEQKRISFTAFENIYSGGYGKEGFWSVNWEHPRVQEIYARIRKFDPPPDETFMSMVEDQARGKLADNYMVNSSDDDPLPKTLPGIKLQRPFASSIRKYEAMTGKRVPPDPNFPDHHITRPSRKGLQEKQAAGASTSLAKQAQWWTHPELLVSCIVAVIVAGFLCFGRRKRSL
jgi:hypothetical protein